MNFKTNNTLYFFSIALITNLLLISISTADNPSDDTTFLKEKQLSTEEMNSFAKISKQQYAQCIEQGKTLKLVIKQLKEQGNKLLIEKDILVERKHELDIKRTQLKLHDPDSVFAYNQLNQKFKQLSLDYNSVAENHNNAIKQYYFDINSLETNCNKKTVLIDY